VNFFLFVPVFLTPHCKKIFIKQNQRLVLSLLRRIGAFDLNLFPSRSYFTTANLKSIAQYESHIWANPPTFAAPLLALTSRPRQRGADAMWTTLFAVTFLIAFALHLVVLSEVD
jgi:hypothetical protein